MPANNADSGKPKLEQTGDGSHTLYSPRFEQHYHNPGGSVTESRHVFFDKNGLREAIESGASPTVLETGFGSGLNLLLLLDTCLEASANASVRYHSVEAYPITGETFSALNYSGFLVHPGLAGELADLFDRIEPGVNRFDLPAGTTLTLFNGFFDDFEGPGEPVDFILHDPFSPAANPELWTGDVFRRLMEFAAPGCLFSTYCAASRARGAMAWAGWNVAREEGALGKREMTLASPDPEKLSHLERVNEEHLARRYEEGDF